MGIILPMRSSEAAVNSYRAAFESALIVRHAAPAVLALRGADCLDLLNRMSTADLAELPSGRTRMTVFTDPLGRTIDVVQVIAREQDLLLLTTGGREAVLRSWLQKHIFFQDDVTVSEPQPNWARWGAYGPSASEALEPLPAPLPHQDRVVSFAGGVTWSVVSPKPGFRVLFEPGADLAAWEKLGGEPSDSLAYEVLRVEAGLPEMGREVKADSIPLEVGLEQAVSFSKGCYVGQEIIARMESRGKLAKRLAGLSLRGAAEPGTPLEQDGRSVGTLTSVAESPRFGWIGLAVVKPKAFSFPEGQVWLRGDAEPARLVELPFESSSQARVTPPLAEPFGQS
mgnify:CR=1 FL=1